MYIVYDYKLSSHPQFNNPFFVAYSNSKQRDFLNVNIIMKLNLKNKIMISIQNIQLKIKFI